MFVSLLCLLCVSCYNGPSVLQVTRIVLLWVNNHFNDFEGDPVMTQFLEDFEKLLDFSVSFRLNSTNR